MANPHLERLRLFSFKLQLCFAFATSHFIHNKTNKNVKIMSSFTCSVFPYLQYMTLYLLRWDMGEVRNRLG